MNPYNFGSSSKISQDIANLYQSIYEGKKKVDQDKDGDNDFADIRIARMIASGVPKEEAIRRVMSKSYNEETELDEAAKRIQRKVRGSKNPVEYMKGRSDAGKRISGDEVSGPQAYTRRGVQKDNPVLPGEKPNPPKVSKSELEYARRFYNSSSRHKVGGPKGLPEADSYEYNQNLEIVEGRVGNFLNWFVPPSSKSAEPSVRAGVRTPKTGFSHVQSMDSVPSKASTSKPNTAAQNAFNKAGGFAGAANATTDAGQKRFLNTLSQVAGRNNQIRSGGVSNQGSPVIMANNLRGDPQRVTVGKQYTAYKTGADKVKREVKVVYDAQGNRKVIEDREYDVFDLVLEYLLYNGYANSQECAEAIMANISEDFREAIIQEVAETGPFYGLNTQARMNRNRAAIATSFNPSINLGPTQSSAIKAGGQSVSSAFNKPTSTTSTTTQPRRESSPANTSAAQKIKSGMDIYRSQIKLGDSRGATETGKSVWAAANPKLAAAAAERARTRGTSATTNPQMAGFRLPAPASTSNSSTKESPADLANRIRRSANTSSGSSSYTPSSQISKK